MRASRAVGCSSSASWGAPGRAARRTSARAGGRRAEARRRPSGGGPKLVGAGESGPAHFGKSVALSGDGTTALVGGLSDAEGRGAVWPFARVGPSLVAQGEKITGAAEGEPHFGYSVAISGDGTLAAVG